MAIPVPREVPCNDPIISPGGQQSSMTDAVNEYLTRISQVIEDLANALAGVELTCPTCEWEPVPKFGLDGLNPDEPPPPDIDEIVVDPINFGGTPPNPPEEPGEIGDPPPFNVPPPGITIPDPPDVDWPVFTQNPPQLSDVIIPGKPEVNLPPVPQLTPISIPAPPAYTIPVWDEEAPVFDLTPPSPVLDWHEEEYLSDLKTKLSEKLYDQVVEGGTGLDEDTEQAIYDRAVSRMLTEEERKYNETLNYFASRGFLLPPGGLAGGLLEIQNAILQVREDLNNDILIQQSKLAQENTHFMIDQARQWEGSLMGYWNNVQERAFQAAVASVESVLKVYQIQVEGYKAELEVYKSKAQVYVSLIQAEQVKAELYRAHIEAVRANVDVQRAYIEAYVAQIQGVAALIELYKAEMEGARLQTEVDLNKIRAYQALVQAYAAQVEAITARFEAYKAQIQGEVAKAQVYQAQVEAFTALVESYKAQAQVILAEAQVETERVKAEVEVYKGYVEKYKTDGEVAVAKAEAEARVAQISVNAYEAQSRNYVGELNAIAQAYGSAVQEARAKVDVCVKEYDILMREQGQAFEQQMQALRAAAQVQGMVVAAAVSTNSISYHTGFTYAQACSVANSYGFQDMNNNIVQNHLLVQHIYDHSE